jgi:hypothetical protein
MVWLLKTVYLYAMSPKEFVVLIICQILMKAVSISVFYWQNVIVFKLIFYIVENRNYLLKHVIDGNAGRRGRRKELLEGLKEAKEY